jgi:hypothetical protein
MPGRRRRPLVETSMIWFVDGESSLRLDRADLLAEYLGMELVEKPEVKHGQNL